MCTDAHTDCPQGNSNSNAEPDPDPDSNFNVFHLNSAFEDTDDEDDEIYRNPNAITMV